jgi:hypothetical protein
LIDLCGLAGFDPFECKLTPKELYEMVKTKTKNQWDHTAFISTAIMNTFSRDKIRFEDVHPFRRTE